jgi:hypothetical protein
LRAVRESRVNALRLGLQQSSAAFPQTSSKFWWWKKRGVHAACINVQTKAGRLFLVLCLDEH